MRLLCGYCAAAVRLLCGYWIFIDYACVFPGKCRMRRVHACAVDPITLLGGPLNAEDSKTCLGRPLMQKIP